MKKTGPSLKIGRLPRGETALQHILRGSLRTIILYPHNCMALVSQWMFGAKPFYQVERQYSGTIIFSNILYNTYFKTSLFYKSTRPIRPVSEIL